MRTVRSSLSRLSLQSDGESEYWSARESFAADGRFSMDRSFSPSRTSSGASTALLTAALMARAASASRCSLPTLLDSEPSSDAGMSGASTPESASWAPLSCCQTLNYRLYRLLCCHSVDMAQHELERMPIMHPACLRNPTAAGDDAKSV